MMPLLNLTEIEKDTIKKRLTSIGYTRSETAAATIAALLPAIGECYHGAIVIFLEEKLADQEAHRLALNGRGLLLSPKRSLFYCGKPNAILIKRMASIDGAILADFNGNCHAYGVILDGKAVTDSNDNNGNKDRGARYNSTKTYLDSVVDGSGSQGDAGTGNIKPARIGIVRSEDGMLDIFPIE